MTEWLSTHMKESRAKKEVMFQSKASNRDVCPAGGWQRVRTQILPTWQRQEVQKKGRGGEKGFLPDLWCLWGTSPGQGDPSHPKPNKERKSYASWRPRALKETGIETGRPDAFNRQNTGHQSSMWSLLGFSETSVRSATYPQTL